MPDQHPNRAAALEAVAGAARLLSQTIHQGEQITLRTYAGDLGNLDRALKVLDATEPDRPLAGPTKQESLFG